MTKATEDIVRRTQRIDPEVTAMLKDGEKVLRIATIHWGIFWKTVFVSVLAIALLITPLQNLGYLLLIVAFIMFVIAALYKKFLILVLTDSRVILRHGIIQLDTIQIRHSRIESVETERTIMGMILGYASVLVYGTGSRATGIPFIADAHEFRKDLDAMLTEYEDKHSTS